MLFLVESVNVMTAEWIDGGIFVLLVFWMILDRCNIYFRH